MAVAPFSFGIQRSLFHALRDGSVAFEVHTSEDKNTEAGEYTEYRTRHEAALGIFDWEMYVSPCV